MPLATICRCGEINCRKHRSGWTTREQNQRKNQRPQAVGVYNTSRHRKLRAYVLARDGQLCQRQLAGCTQHATTIGHITPFSGPDDPAAWDSRNVWAECAHCNGKEAATRQAGARRADA